MTSSLETEPWRELPAELADAIEPELPAMTEEILATIASQVPEYARPLEGSFGRGIRVGVSEALRQFLALIRDPDAGREPGRDVYIGLGRGELGQGRTLDALQSAYRVGARVAWRRTAEAARRAGAKPEVLSLLAESIFAYIDELSADSVEGYAEAASQLEGERQRRRRELAALLLRDPPADEADLSAAARAADWALPQTIAALACPEEELGRIVGRLPTDALATSADGTGCVLIADPTGPGRAGELERASAGARAALGPVGSVSEAPSSWRLARSALAAIEAGAMVVDGLLRAEDRLPDLLLFEGRAIAERLARRRLGPFAALTPKARQRMELTALAYIDQRGNAAAMARVLHIHPQTARYRLARLREILGDELDDPEARFELELALRAHRSPPEREPAAQA